MNRRRQSIRRLIASQPSQSIAVLMSGDERSEFLVRAGLTREELLDAVVEQVGADSGAWDSGGDDSPGYSGRGLLLVAVGALIVVLSTAGLYALNFGAGGLSRDPSRWSGFGDYFGGLLNPILSFAALCILLYTVMLQLRELSYSRRELRLTRGTLQATVDEARIASLERSLFHSLQRYSDLIEKVRVAGASTRGFEAIRGKVKHGQSIEGPIFPAFGSLAASIQILQSLSAAVSEQGERLVDDESFRRYRDLVASAASEYEWEEFRKWAVVERSVLAEVYEDLLGL